jgi:diguanylate cyclase (GGDEF)-like protein
MVTAIPIIVDDSMIVVELIKNITGSMINSELEIAGSMEIRKLLDKANIAAVTDEMTGVFNKRHIMERLPVDIIMSGLNMKPLSVMITDIDFFKKVNDEYGHLAGDLVLKEFARILKENVRDDIDWIGRFGGEEFVVCLSQTSIEDAFKVGERIREYVQSYDFCYKDKIINITASFGLCTVTGVGEDYEKVINCADEKLYTAKRTGRNKVVF